MPPRLLSFTGLAVALLLASRLSAEANSPATADAPPAALRLDLGENVSLDLVLIPAGTFTQGSPEWTGENDEAPPHLVTISQPFYLGRCEVTQAQWTALMGTQPSRFHGADLPVETVSWHDCQDFLARLSARTGRTCRLPTEAQWEYACRGGTDTPWSFGSEPADAPAHAWMTDNAKGRTHPVGTLLPNPWGLHDLHGNVWEWCADWYQKHAYTADPVTDPTGPATGESRISRGGAWGDAPDGLRSAIRNCNGPDGANQGTGFRVLVTLPRQPAPAP